MTSDSRQHAIREMAYAKWEQAGCPPGDGLNFWMEAEQEILGQHQSDSSSCCEAVEDRFEASFPDTEVTPLKIAKSGGNARKRAS